MLVIALFIRDAFQIPTAAGIPPLSPPVPAVSGVPAATPDVVRQWQQWWDQLLAYEGTRREGGGPWMPRGAGPRMKPDESRYPRLAAVAAEAWDPAVRYANQRAREAPDLFRHVGPDAVEREYFARRRPLRWRPRPVDVGVTVIPVGGPLAMPRAGCHLLLSRQSYSDRGAYRAALDETLLLAG
ncbi:MAG: hypothetical protein ACRDOK_13655 [Streptosporangiaceae bacterium]